MTQEQTKCKICDNILSKSDINIQKRWHAPKGFCPTCIQKHKRNLRDIKNNTDINIRYTDSLSFMRSLNDNTINLVLTDVPYIISKATGFKNGNGVERLKISMDFGKWDREFTLEDLKNSITEYYRLLRPGGYLIIFYDLWKIQELAKLLEDQGFKQLRFIEWIKTNPVPINSKINYLTNSREVAICAVKGGKPTFNSKYDNGVYSYPIYHGKDRCHPTQKPIKLFEDLIKKHSNPRDTVLDTFLGSGTTIIACMNTDRKCLGCEKDNKYFYNILDRVNNHVN